MGRSGGSPPRAGIGPFRQTLAARVGRDPAFREALLREGIEALLAGDVGTGKAVLRDYINATVGFEALAAATGISAKSLMRMFGPNGNPQDGGQGGTQPTRR